MYTRHGTLRGACHTGTLHSTAPRGDDGSQITHKAAALRTTSHRPSPQGRVLSPLCRMARARSVSPSRRGSLHCAWLAGSPNRRLAARLAFNSIYPELGMAASSRPPLCCCYFALHRLVPSRAVPCRAGPCLAVPCRARPPPWRDGERVTAVGPAGPAGPIPSDSRSAAVGAARPPPDRRSTAARPPFGPSVCSYVWPCAAAGPKV